MKSYRLKAIAAVFATAILLSACGQPSGDTETGLPGTVAVLDSDGQGPLPGTEQEPPPAALNTPQHDGTYIGGDMSKLPTCLLFAVALDRKEAIPRGASVEVQIARDPEFQDTIVDETGEDIRPHEVGYGEFHGRYRYVYPDHAEPWSATSQYSVQYPCVE